MVIHLPFIIGSFVFSLCVAAVDWVVVARRHARLDYVFKPATLVAVFFSAWLLTQGVHDIWQARFFLPGLAFSLAGDVLLLMPGKRFFLAALVSFLLAHACYIAGLNPTLPPWPAPALLIFVAIVGVPLYRAIAAGLRRRGQSKLLAPVVLYGVVIGLMLCSAWATLFRPQWSPLRRGLVVAGASLFFVSDTMLAWDRFVVRSHLLHVLVRITYHLGQMALAASLGYW